MKLTKTESRILAYMADHSGRYGAAHSYGRGMDGGKVEYGLREYDACFSLVRKGLARNIGQHRSQVYKNGFCVHVADISIAITLDGRIFIK